MARLCQVIVGGVHEMLTVNIRVMSAAGLASLFLEMNFIEGIIPSSFKSDAFDESIEQCYELLLSRLLELVKRKPPSSSSALGKVWHKLVPWFFEGERTELHEFLRTGAGRLFWGRFGNGPNGVIAWLP